MITTAVWEQREHPPASEFFAVIRIAEKLLKARWDDEQVTAAMVAVSTVSVRACEFWLNERRRVAAPAIEVDTDRDAPTGRIEL